MTILQFNESQTYRKLIGSSTFGAYMASLGLFLGGIISDVVFGCTVGVCLVMLVAALLVPPMSAESSIFVSEKRIRYRTSTFTFRSLSWKSIVDVAMYSTFIEIQTRKGKLFELPVAFLKYGSVVNLKARMKKIALRNGITVIDTEIHSIS